MEKEPWYTRVEGPFPEWQGPVGVKEDGGGSTYAQGKVGDMVIHRAVNNKNAEGEWTEIAGGSQGTSLTPTGKTDSRSSPLQPFFFSFLFLLISPSGRS